VSEELVLTPGGYRARSLVHHLEPGHALGATDNRRHHLVESRTAVAAWGSGWIVDTRWANDTGDPISEFVSTWTVPPPPATESGQTIYLFNALQNSTLILQPVLQWEPPPAGGDGYWTVASWVVASWHVDDQAGPAFHTPPIPVNPGDNLVGLMKQLPKSESDTLFSYSCEFLGLADTLLHLYEVEELNCCFETLEAYDITQCSDYPNTDLTAFSAISLETSGGTRAPMLQWSVEETVTDCGQHGLVVSNANPGGEVHLFYRSTPAP
jgi:hypothetical protein